MKYPGRSDVIELMIKLRIILPIFMAMGIAWILPAPHLQTAWGDLKGDTIAVSSMMPVLDSALSVTDEKGTTYKITRYQFSYKRLSQFQDDSTGLVKTNYSLVSKIYYNTSQLDTLWINNIRGSLQAGDSFIINGIIVKDDKGKKLLAPGLEFHIN
jgi:hypothetical protein